MSQYEKSIDLYGDNIGRVDYVSHMGSDLTVVNSARVSFGTTKSELDKRDRKLIRYLVAHKHTSTLEHCVVTFKFVVPLYIRSQHHRHRTWSYNEISRRYTDKDLQFYCPKEFRTQHKSNRQASNPDELADPYLWKEPKATLVPVFHPRASEVYREHCATSLRLFEELLNKVDGVLLHSKRDKEPRFY